MVFNENPAEVFVLMIFQLLYWSNCFQILFGSNWETSCMSIVTTCILLDSFLTFWNQLILKLNSQLSWFFDENPAEAFVLMIFQLLYWSNCFQILFGSNWETSCISTVNPWTLLDSSLTLWIWLSLTLYSASVGFLTKVQPKFLYLWFSSCYTGPIVFKSCSEVTEKLPAFQLWITGLYLIHL